MKLSIKEIKSMSDEKLLGTYISYMKNEGIFEKAHINNGTEIHNIIDGIKADIFTHFIHAGDNMLHKMARYDAPLHIPAMQLWDNK